MFRFENPVIAAVRSKEEFLSAISSPVDVVFLLKSTINDLKEAIDAKNSSGKQLFLHADMCDGLGKDKAGMQYLSALGMDGIISTRTNVIAAAKAAHADSFIRRLPQGYDTPLTGGGAGLSQGQRQLLCISRILLTDPPMLILDEATSSIDTRTEVRIQKAFDTLMAGRTSFVVAHRLSTIRSADCILVMEAGRIVEQGTHDELLAKNGAYARLYNSQFAPTEQGA